MNKEVSFITEFVENAIYRMDENTRMVQKSLLDISEEELWKRPNQSSNSIANLLLHLKGNIGQYIISSLGGSPDVRDRDTEFATRSAASKKDVLNALNETVETAKTIIANCSIADFLRKRMVQGYHLSGIGIVMHVVEHYSYHTGQIAFWVKQLKNKDLSFYESVDLNIKNKD